MTTRLSILTLTILAAATFASLPVADAQVGQPTPAQALNKCTSNTGTLIPEPVNSLLGPPGGFPGGASCIALWTKMLCTLLAQPDTPNVGCITLVLCGRNVPATAAPAIIQCLQEAANADEYPAQVQQAACDRLPTGRPQPVTNCAPTQQEMQQAVAEAVCEIIVGNGGDLQACLTAFIEDNNPDGLPPGCDPRVTGTFPSGPCTVPDVEQLTCGLLSSGDDLVACLTAFIEDNNPDGLPPGCDPRGTGTFPSGPCTVPDVPDVLQIVQAAVCSLVFSSDKDDLATCLAESNPGSLPPGCDPRITGFPSGPCTVPDVLPDCDPAACLSEGIGIALTITITDGSASSDTMPLGATCSGNHLYEFSLPADTPSPTPPGAAASCIQLTIDQDEGARTTIAADRSQDPSGGISPGAGSQCISTLVCIDIDATPLSGEGCGPAGTPRQWHGRTCTDNTINETADHDGDGRSDPTPTWILINFTSDQAGADNGLAFPDGRGVVVKELHIKWPHDNPGAGNAVAPDFAGFATEYSNLDNDDDTDFMELSSLLVCGGLANPTNPYSDCDDWDGDGLPNGSDPAPNVNNAVQVRVLMLDGTPVTPNSVLQAPASLDVQFVCRLNSDQVKSVTLDLGHDYLGPGVSRIVAIPPTLCDGGWHSLDAVPGMAKPVYQALKTKSGTGTTDAAAPQPDPFITATTKDGYSPRSLAGAARFTLTPFEAIRFNVNQNGRTAAPISLAGSSVTCVLPSGLTSMTDPVLILGLDAALASHGDESNGSPSTLAGCSGGAGTPTLFAPTYYANLTTTTPRSVILTATAKFPGANDVVWRTSLSVENLAETGTLTASCTPSPCSTASTSVQWTLTPSSLTDEGGQDWSSVTLLNNNAPIGKMTRAGNLFTFLETRDSGAPNAYSASVFDAGRRVSALAPGVILNAVPDIERFQAPQELPGVPVADPKEARVQVLVTAIVTDLGPAGGSATGDTFRSVQVRLREAETLDASRFPVSPATLPFDLKPMSPAPPVRAMGLPVDGTSKDGELYYASVPLSPFKSYTYCFHVEDSAGIVDTDTNSVPDVPCDGATGYLFASPAVLPGRPVSLANVAAYGAAATTTDKLGDLLDAICPGKVDLANPASGAQPCLASALYGACGMPADSQPTDVPGKCKTDVRDAVLGLAQTLADLAERTACGDNDLASGECADSLREDATTLLQGLVSQVCANTDQNANPACGGDLLNLVLPDPVKALTGADGCNFRRPLEWGASNHWNDRCDSESGDLGDLVAAVQGFLSTGNVPDAGLPIDQKDPQDRDGDGQADDANGQVDFVEERVVAFDPDEAGDDPDDRFDGGAAASGLTLVVFKPTPTTPLDAPAVLATVRLGDVAGTPMTEVLVVEQAGTVTCVFSNGLAGLYVYNGTRAFRAQGSDTPEAACGSQRASSATVQVSEDLGTNPGQPKGLMVWIDQDGNGTRTGNAADNGNATRSNPKEDVVGFRLVPGAGASAPKVFVNVKGEVTPKPADPNDTDGDGVLNAVDNCPAVVNADQANHDGDANGGDACDTDDDNDGKPDASDTICPRGAIGPADSDGQADGGDLDGDGCRNSEDSDDDDDGKADSLPDLCPRGTTGAASGASTAPTADPDGDGCKNSEDTDDDNDGVLDAGTTPDNCPVTANPTQADHDGDGQGDACDTDDDNDGTSDLAPDACPTGIPGPPAADNKTANGDYDGDGCKNSEDPDDDGDAVPDARPDACGFSATKVDKRLWPVFAAIPVFDGCFPDEKAPTVVATLGGALCEALGGEGEDALACLPECIGGAPADCLEALGALHDIVCAALEDADGPDCPPFGPDAVCEGVADDPGKLPGCVPAPLPTWVVDCLTTPGAGLQCFDPLCSTITGAIGPVQLGSFPTCLLPDQVNECLDGAAACPLPCKVNNPQGCAAPPCSPTGPPVSCGPYLQGILS
ncbi:MAG TPA: thrombospondin type 3 repeat-containing protein, partial [Candidatus Thermoplasmatota archaeon]|nr:thrombospondin type 3 repeat-containing protein [Candidatus Thermoplasmatota archaeon]